jgi:hypothetical protein
VALVIGLVSTASVSGMLFSYLVLWSWGTTTLCLTATGATAVMAAEAWSRRRQDIGQPRPRWAVRVAPLLAAVLIVASGALALDATQAAPPAEGEAEAFDALIPPLVGGISDGSLPGGGRRGRYVVETSDAYNPGLSGYTVMLELERHGINAGVPTYFRTGAGAHRVLTRDEATAVITFVSGADHVAEWHSRPEATLVAEFTPPADTRRKETELRRQIVALVERVGHPELVDHMDGSALGTTAHPDMPLEALPPLSEMIALPHPSAIFVSPPTT